MCYDFNSARMFSKAENGTGFHAAKSFDSVLCRKSETMMFVATSKVKTVVTNTVKLAILHACYYI